MITRRLRQHFLPSRVPTAVAKGLPRGTPSCADKKDTYLEYIAYGFFAALESSLLFETPVWPSVADFLLPPAAAADDEAGEPKYISLFFLTPGVTSVVPLDCFWHLAHTMMGRCTLRSGTEVGR